METQKAQPITGIIENTSDFAQLISQPARLSRYEKFEESDDLLAEAAKIATALDGAIRKAKLAVSIQGRQYITLEGWQTLGGLLGLGPKTIETRRVSDGVGHMAYHATVAIVDGTTGRELARAHGYCGSEEAQKTSRGRRDRWIDDFGAPQEFAILSMSQTRATVKAFSALLRWIPKLSGYEGTPYEEMESVGKGEDSAPAPKVAAKKTPKADVEYVNEDDLTIIHDHATARAKELGSKVTAADVVAGCLKPGAKVEQIPRGFVGNFLAKIEEWVPKTPPPPPEDPLPEEFGDPLPDTVNTETGEVH